MNTICKDRGRKLLFALILAAFCLALAFFSPDSHAVESNTLIGAHIEDGQLLGYYGEGGDIVIPNTVTAIASEAFKDNDNVTSVTIPGSVQLIGYYAFDGCTALEKVIFSDPVDGADLTIRIDAFANCPKLSEAEIPATAAYVTGNIFKNCPSMTEIRVHEDNPYYFTDEYGVLFGPWVDYGEPQYDDANYALTGYPAGRTGGYTVPDEVNGKKINQVWASAFRQTKGLTSIDFEEGITILGGNAFEETGLKEIVIPDTVTSLGASLFKNCTELREVTLPDGVSAVPFSCFEGCTSLMRINFPDSITTFEIYAFKDCSSLTSMIMPSKLTSITLAAFEGCTNLQRVVIPPSVINFPSDEYVGYYDPFEDAPRSLVVYVEKGSAAEKWAFNNIGSWGYSYETLDDVSDLSGIGSVSYYLIDMGNKIKLDGSFPVGATLKVTPVYSGAEYDAFRGEAGEGDLRVYEISLLPQDTSASGDLNLSIGLPTSFTKNAKLYSYDGGSVSALKTSVISRTASADVSGTGYFALIDSNAAPEDGNEVTGIKLNRSSAELKAGGRLQLSATVEPATAANKSVSWSSSDERIATVDGKGVVTAVSAGSAKITATTYNGLSASCSVTVTGSQEPPATDETVQTNAALHANNAAAGSGASAFSLSLSQASRIATVEVTFETSTDQIKVTGQNGFSTIGDVKAEEKDGSYTCTAVLAYLNGNKELFSGTGTQVIAQISVDADKATLKVTDLKVAGWDEDETVLWGKVNGISPDEATFEGSLSYDVNGDGAVDLKDITEAQKHYRAAEGDEEWDEASRCDFVADGVISVDDFIEIWLHYTK